MSAMIEDLVGLAVGTVLTPLVGWLPGFALLRLFERRGFDAGGGWARCGWAGLLAVCLLPAVDALAIRFAGLGVASACHVLLGAAAVPDLVARLRTVRPPLPRPWLALPRWWVIVAVVYVDVAVGPALYQSRLVLELVKHAALIESIDQAGLPLRDPFFARDVPSGYYYYYYLAPAMVHRLGSGLVDACMAFAAAASWTGVLVPAALWRTARDAGFVAAGRGARVFAVLTGLCFVCGADLPVALVRMTWTRLLQPEVVYGRFVTMASAWVPHHLSAAIACFTGSLLLDRARRAGAAAGGDADGRGGAGVRDDVRPVDLACARRGADPGTVAGHRRATRSCSRCSRCIT